MTHPQPLDRDDGPFHEPPASPPREPVFNLAPVVIALIAACAIVHLVRMMALTGTQDIGVLVRFAFIPIRYSGLYEIDVYAWFSPLSYAFLHGGVAHLAVNMVWLAAFGSPLAHRIGWPRFLAFWAFTSAGAAGLHYFFHAGDPTPVVGASGAVSGMMGAAARFAFQIDRDRRMPAFTGPILPVSVVLRHRATLTFLLVWFVLNLAIGLGFSAPGIGQVAWEAHIGGLLAGFFGLALFDRRRRAPFA